MKPFYITTTLPYVNAEPHIGFAMEIIRADIIARSKKAAGHDVFFNTGTDEHGIKIYRKAKEQNIEPQEYCDKMALKFKAILPALGIMPEINFIRTTDPHHVAAAQEFWKLVDKNGYIYKKNYSVKYCVGCELEKTDSELVNGRCPLHPLTELEIIQEENYFFKWSAFQQKLLDLYAERPDFVIPDFRFNEIKAFVERGLEDFSISRIKSKMPWGIPVPGDEDQVMYVWFDALVDYISAIGWPDDEVQGKNEKGAFKKWWMETGGVVQYCGKDNLRQQSAMWQAMLMAAGLEPSRQIVINGFVTGEGGIKMSKSLGNTVDPLEIVKEYGTDALRYYVARELSPFEDSPFTKEKFKETFNAGLANGIGNLTSRVLKMVVDNGVKIEFKPVKPIAIDGYNIKAACDEIWKLIQEADKSIQDQQPFKVVKTDPEKGKEMIATLGGQLYTIAQLLEPIIPETAAKIQEHLRENKMPAAPLFARR
ncbi:MAG: metG [Candidatus Parcubacteria bacterium]|nr:metG [Candidatus Parcubacteria bacterium]